MEALKKLPISYTGQLNDVKLIAFTVDYEEIRDTIPNGINPVVKNGKAMFTLVSVRLEGMKANVLPVPFSYDHVALRLCVNDRMSNESEANQGVYFYRSYTDKWHMVKGGKALTNYNLEMAKIKSNGMETAVISPNHYIKFGIDINQSKKGSEELFQKIQKLDRAYFMNANSLYRTCITRKEWPIEWCECYAFETNIFNSVEVVGAFYIASPIEYKWNKPERVTRI